MWLSSGRVGLALRSPPRVLPNINQFIRRCPTTLPPLLCLPRKAGRGASIIPSVCLSVYNLSHPSVRVWSSLAMRTHTHTTYTSPDRLVVGCCRIKIKSKTAHVFLYPRRVLPQRGRPTKLNCPPGLHRTASLVDEHTHTHTHPQY